MKTLKKEGGSDRSVSNTNFSSVTLNEVAMKHEEAYCNLVFQQDSFYKMSTWKAKGVRQK